jgi:hypothetical protein
LRYRRVGHVQLSEKKKGQKILAEAFYNKATWNMVLERRLRP